MEHEQDAANLSSAEVLAAFGELLLPLAAEGVGEAEGGSLGAGERPASGGGAQAMEGVESTGSGEGAGGSSCEAPELGQLGQEFEGLLAEVKRRVKERQLLEVRAGWLGLSSA